MPARLIVGLLAVIVLAAAYTAMLPPGAAQATSTVQSTWPMVKGAYHIHSDRSDGTGTIDEIAEAAAHAGLQFVILTDHGDGTRPPEPPSYRSGVLCIDTVEVSLSDGHLTALALPQMPFRLAGRARDVIEDVRRFGGISIAAHPGSPKAALRWTDWDARFDGLEWLNADSEWRDEVWASLGRVLLTYPIRPAETLATLLDRPDAVVAQWDRLTRARHVVGMAGADTHARLGVRSSSEPYEDRVFARLPSYEASFRAFVNHVVLNGPLTGDPGRDAHEVLEAVRRGRVATSIEGLARLGGLEMQAVGSGRVARMGEYLDSAAGAELKIKIGAPAGTTLVLLRDGAQVFEIDETEITTVLGAEPAAYRIEAHLPPSLRARSVPWVVTNPIYVNLAAAHRGASHGPPAGERERTAVATGDWQVESSADSESALSRGALEDGAPALFWTLRLGGEVRTSPYTAIRFPIQGKLASQRGIQLRARADRPMRIWAQLRAPGERGGRRWMRSLYVDRGLRPVDLMFDQFTPEATTGARSEPPLTDIDSLLLVADTMHTLPGTSATIAISDLWLVR